MSLLRCGLGNFEHDDSYTVVKEIIEDIKFQTKGDFSQRVCF
jgi:hypothetical protein